VEAVSTTPTTEIRATVLERREVEEEGAGWTVPCMGVREPLDSRDPGEQLRDNGVCEVIDDM
jgi:hypothetical protein